MSRSYRNYSLIRRLGCLIVALSFFVVPVQAQKVAKYGADFLSGGVGGRALGMGGAHVGIVSDVSAGYWNASGLSYLQYPEVAYMHAERFSGVVSFDYAGVALPVSRQSTVGLTLIRSAVDDIPNTLNAWDVERNQPRPNPENFIERFSAADYAIMLSYARQLRDNLSVGVTGKIIRRTIGDFANAWGYSFDVSVQYALKRLFLGANVQDISTMLQTWSVNRTELALLEDFGQEIPEGGSVLVSACNARLGAGYLVPQAPKTGSLLAADLDIAFRGAAQFCAECWRYILSIRAFGIEYEIQQVVALKSRY